MRPVSMLALQRRPKVRMAVLISLDCDAKVRCDYATEKSIFNRIFNRIQESVLKPLFMGGNYYLKKICD